MAWLVLYGSQSALAQSVACSPIVPVTPPSNTVPTSNNPAQLNLGSLQLSPGSSLIINQSILQGSLSLNQVYSSNLPSSGIGVVSIVSSGSGVVSCQGGTPTLIPAWCTNLALGGDVIQYQQDIARQFLSLFHINAPDGPTAVADDSTAG